MLKLIFATIFLLVAFLLFSKAIRIVARYVSRPHTKLRAISWAGIVVMGAVFLVSAISMWIRFAA